MLIHHHTVRQRKTLARALADFLGRKEWVEYLVANRHWYAGTGIGYGDLHFDAVNTSAHAELAAIAAILDYIGDGMRRVHQQIQDHLIDLPQIAFHLGQFTEFSVDLGDILVFVVRYDQSA